MRLMKIRPSDANGDIMPVIDSVSMRTGNDAVSELVKDQLSLLCGDWWENPAWGNMGLDMFRESRRTEADLKAIASYIISYIQDTAGVQDVRDVQYSVSGKGFQLSCTIITNDGSARINYELN